MIPPRHPCLGGIETGRDGARPSRAPVGPQCPGPRRGRAVPSGSGCPPGAGGSFPRPAPASVLAWPWGPQRRPRAVPSRGHGGVRGGPRPHGVAGDLHELSPAPRRPVASPVLDREAAPAFQAGAPAMPTLPAQGCPLWRGAGGLWGPPREGTGREQGGRRGSRGAEQAHGHLTGLRGALEPEWSVGGFPAGS